MYIADWITFTSGRRQLATVACMVSKMVALSAAKALLESHSVLTVVLPRDVSEQLICRAENSAPQSHVHSARA